MESCMCTVCMMSFFGGGGDGDEDEEDVSVNFCGEDDDD